MLLNSMKVNPDFGKNLYTTIQPTLFYITLIVILYSFIMTLISFAKDKEKFRILDVIKQVFISCLIIFIVNCPLILESIGEHIYKFAIDLLSNLNNEGLRK
ncbi:MAG: hypothetical protein JW924_08505 [Fusobacteriaceae bacterium]|nr:hypothetical protein [Fusobacteriaceae bacterium]